MYSKETKDQINLKTVQINKALLIASNPVLNYTD